MKDILFSLMIFITRIAYGVLRNILPTRDTVVFLSRQSDTPSIDFQLLQKELKKQAPHLRQKTYCRRMDGEGSLRDLLYLIKPTLALLTARGCFVDGQCIPLSLYKQRRGFVAVQVWHALGALKKFGWQAVGLPDGRSLKDAMRWNMHRHYTFVTCASEATRALYGEGFNVPNEDILVLGMPRIDEILRICNSQAVRDKIYAAHPSWEGMVKLLYVPTFRKGRPLDIKPLLDVLTPEMREKYKLIVKVHPNDVKPEAPADIAFTSIPTFDLFSVADAIVTDYSAAAIEASLSGRPLYFYVPDLKEYRQSAGLNIRLEEEMPGAVFTDFKELINALENNEYDRAQLVRFRRKYVSTADTRNTKRIVEEFLRRIDRA